MEKEEEKSNTLYVLPELVEGILIRLPPKYIFKFRTVSKQWKSILESESFAERRMTLCKPKRILAALDSKCCPYPHLIRKSTNKDISYLHYNASQPLIHCDGLICFLQKDWIIVSNPLTKQIRRFPSGLNHKTRSIFVFGVWSTFNPENWAMGFGKDKVTRMYKVVRMCFSYWEAGRRDRVVECSVLVVQTGEWRKLNPPLQEVNPGSQSVCVNGSIYWLHMLNVEYGYKILALDLHTEEFHNVSIPPTEFTPNTHIVNLEDRLAYAKTAFVPEWILEIWTMDTSKEQWIKDYTISLDHGVGSTRRWFKPVLFTMQRNLIFHDNHKRVFKYFPKTDEIRCCALNTCVISPYLENLVMLPWLPHLHPHPIDSNAKCPLSSTPKSRNFNFLKQRILDIMKQRVLEIMFTSIVVLGYFLLPP